MDTLKNIQFKNKLSGSYTLDDEDIIFCYVKNYCPWSKKACKKLVELNHDNLYAYDLINQSYVCPKNFQKELKKGNAVDFFQQGLTVPQIFILNANKSPKYIGGHDDLMALQLIEASTNNVETVHMSQSLKF